MVSVARALGAASWSRYDHRRPFTFGLLENALDVGSGLVRCWAALIGVHEVGWRGGGSGGPWRGGGGGWRAAGETAESAQAAGEEATWIFDPVGPCTAGAAHVGVECVFDVAAGPYVGVDAGAGQGVTDTADVPAVQAIAEWFAVVGIADQFIGKALEG